MSKVFKLFEKVRINKPKYVHLTILIQASKTRPIKCKESEKLHNNKHPQLHTYSKGIKKGIS